jgi:uridine phosphorylase
MQDERIYPPSELVVNTDGSVFHLHLKYGQVATKIILVGDPGRADLVARHFTSIECDVCNREFHTITGFYGSKRISVVSTGIGCGNIDIVLNELDALFNIDLAARKDKPSHTTLELVRIGTCGGLQEYTGLGSRVCSVRSIGLDGLLNFYARRNEVCDIGMELAFVNHMKWDGGQCTAYPYVSIEDEELTSRIAADDAISGITVSAVGFYGPQGRSLRGEPADVLQNSHLASFQYDGMQVLNYEMESSAMAGLAKILGHKAACICLVVAARRQCEAFTDYGQSMDTLIDDVLQRI